MALPTADCFMLAGASPELMAMASSMMPLMVFFMKSGTLFCRPAMEMEWLET